MDSGSKRNKARRVEATSEVESVSRCVCLLARNDVHEPHSYLGRRAESVSCLRSPRAEMTGRQGVLHRAVAGTGERQCEDRRASRSRQWWLSRGMLSSRGAGS